MSKEAKAFFCMYRGSSRMGPWSAASAPRHCMKEINDYYNFIFSLYEIPRCRALAIIKKFMTKNLMKIKFLENRVEMRPLKCKRKCN